MTQEQRNPEYRAWCVNGDLYGYAEVAPAEGGFEVTLYADYASLAVAAGYGADFPLEMTLTGQDDAHRYARGYAEALIEQAKAEFRAEHGEEPDEDDYRLQTTNGAYA